MRVTRKINYTYMAYRGVRGRQHHEHVSNIVRNTTTPMCTKESTGGKASFSKRSTNSYTYLAARPARIIFPFAPHMAGRKERRTLPSSLGMGFRQWGPTRGCDVCVSRLERGSTFSILPLPPLCQVLPYIRSGGALIDVRVQSTRGLHFLSPSVFYLDGENSPH